MNSADLNRLTRIINAPFHTLYVRTDETTNPNKLSSWKQACTIFHGLSELFTGKSMNTILSVNYIKLEEELHSLDVGPSNVTPIPFTHVDIKPNKMCFKRKDYSQPAAFTIAWYSDQYICFNTNGIHPKPLTYKQLYDNYLYTTHSEPTCPEAQWFQCHKLPAT